MDPFFFKLPIQQFDLGLIPRKARMIGSEEFKRAVVDHFVQEYAGNGCTALVSVDDQFIEVATFPTRGEPIDIVLEMLNAGRIKEAIPFLEALDRARPDDPKILYNLGIAYSELRQFDEAVIRLKRVVKLVPSHSHAWTGIGVAYQRMGQAKQAAEALFQAVKVDSTDGYAHRNLGAVLLIEQRFDEALSHFREACRQLPNDPQAMIGLAQCLQAIAGDAVVAEADHLYKEVIDRFPASPAAAAAREARTKAAHQALRSASPVGYRPDVVLYIAGALNTFKSVGGKKRQEIAFEIAMLGQRGLDINDPQKKYTLKTLPGEFSGLHLLAIMYAGFRQIDPTIDTGADFSKEYEMALAIEK